MIDNETRSNPRLLLEAIELLEIVQCRRGKLADRFIKAIELVTDGSSIDKLESDLDILREETGGLCEVNELLKDAIRFELERGSMSYVELHINEETERKELEHNIKGLKINTRRFR